MSLSKSHTSPQRLLRPELLHLLDHSQTVALTLILAPAGSGKSTLLQQWRSQTSHGTVAHLSLNRRDQDAMYFFHRLHKTVAQYVAISPVLSGNALEADAQQLDVFVQCLLDAFNTLATDFFLLLDDFHYASSPLIQQFFADLVNDLPAHIHVIIASRNYPAFPLSRLKLDDQLLLIDQHDLRLPLAQIHEFCDLLQQPALTHPETDELVRITEGWIAGIKLALLARAKTGQLATGDFQGTHPEIVNYFLDVVLNELDAPLREFLLVSAILDKVDAKIMSFLLPNLDCWPLLQRVWQKNLFIHPLDEQSHVYRYHPLFQQSLQTRLWQESPLYAQQLHLRASNYFLQHHEPESALHHAQQLQDLQRFYQILAQCCQQWLKEGKLALMLSWLQQIDAHLRLAQPNLALLHLCALIFSRQFSAAFYQLGLLKQQIGHDDHANTVMTLHFLENVLLLFHDDNYDPAPALNDLNQHKHYYDIRDAAHTFLARHAMLQGDCEAAIRYAKYAKTLLTELNHDYLSSFNDVILILSERELGHVVVARQMTQAFFQQYAKQPQTPCWVNAATCMAVSLYEQNRCAEAKDICEQLMLTMDSACVTELMFHVYVTLARLQGTAANQRANQLLLQLRRILRHGQHSRLLNQLLAEEICHSLRTQQLEHLLTIVHDYDLLADITQQSWLSPPSTYQESWVYRGLAAALYLRSRKQYAAALTILTVLDQHLARYQLCSRRTIIKANQIVLLSLQGNAEEAKQLLVRLCHHAGIQAGIRTVFDEAPGFAHIVRDAHQKGIITLPDIYLQHYRDVLYPYVGTPTTLAADQLTAKEYEILSLIQKGLSNKDIAQTVGISLSTTKWHIQNIFSKLQVSNRASVVSLLVHQKITV
ncbi:helix-turn-helix transcriptional regulator [Agitococcus lubricus]|uniref:LuxR family maltose regulon positive regulatory protein n=1 Tax=Agitococcus lubricus TaxID=1077255 RepID=A0A2T5J186_9GAMM|nr:LuxR C-terminal-related transcriptional regulator [Agitococcus lubricus]PTQ90152.1 LuxR family maltose regulon positive regulatory protein [Agitococcus lubricus]